MYLKIILLPHLRPAQHHPSSPNMLSTLLIHLSNPPKYTVLTPLLQPMAYTFLDKDCHYMNPEPEI